MLVLALVLACTPGDGSPGDSGAVGGGAEKPALLPFPSAHLLDDAGNLDLPETMPMVEGGTPFPAARLRGFSGFSPVQTTVIDPEVRLDPTSLPSPDQLDDEGSVQLWDLSSGARWPAFAELDAFCDAPEGEGDEACDDEVPTLLVRPLMPMTGGHRYAVALTAAVRQDDGSAFGGPAWYRDLMAGRPGDGLDAWVDHYVELAAVLEDLGVQDLVFAVDFPVDCGGRSLLDHVVDAVSVPQSYRIDSVQDSDAGDTLPPGTWKQAQGSFVVDSFLVDDVAFSLDAGLPVAAGTADAELFVHIPDSVRDAAPGTVPVWIFGHGIFSRPSDYLADPDDSSAVVALADQAGAILVATTWRGLTYTDLPTAIAVGSDFGRIPELTDKLAQAVANNVALHRLLAEGDLLDDPLFEGLPDGVSFRYYGISLGGIEGASLMAVDRELPHAVLHVGGSSWSTMLERSSNWPQFETLVRYGVASPRHRQLLYAASQLFWDEADPACVVDDLADRSVLWQESIGDEQVPNITTELLVRGVGATLLQPAVTDPQGVASASGPLTGPALAQFDPQLGVPDMVNRPADVSGAHGTPRTWATTMTQTARFLDRDDPGVVEHPCGDEPCTADNAEGR